MTQPTFRDVELISAYLDGQLSPADAARLESRLKTDSQVKAVFEELSQARTLLRKLPSRRAPRNFMLTPKMAGIKPPLPRSFPVFRFASVLASVLFFFAFLANLSVPAVVVLRAAAPAPAFGMGGGGYGGGGDGVPSAMESAPAAAQAPALPAAPSTTLDVAVTAAPELRIAAPTQSAELAVVPTEQAPAAGAQEKINPNAQDQSPVPQPQEQVQLPISPFILVVLLFLAVLSAGLAYVLRSRAETAWYKSHALLPGRISTKQVAGILAAMLVFAALIAVIFWLATTPFYMPASATGSFPAGSGDKGPVTSGDKGPATGGDKGGPAASQEQTFSLTPGMGYEFTSVDSIGLVTAIDFPQDVFNAEMLVTYSPGLVVQTGGIDFQTLSSFSLMPADQSMQPQVPFTISLDYDPNVVADIDQNTLVLMWWSGTEWQDAATTCSPASTYERRLDVYRLLVPICRMGGFVLAVP